MLDGGFGIRIARASVQRLVVVLGFRVVTYLEGRTQTSLWFVTYDLTRLGDLRFEHLVQALALANLGAGVQIFGAGPDGGREATFTGKVKMEGKGEWDGYGVIQAKYKGRLETTTADQKWFFQQVTAELDAWVNRKK